MLRRKLLTRIGLLVACFVVGAAAAIYLLQSTVADINRINADAVALVDGMHTASDLAALTEEARGAGGSRAGDQLVATLDRLGAHAVFRTPDSEPSKAYRRVRERLAAFVDPSKLSPEQATASDAAFHGAMRDLSHATRRFVSDEQAGFGDYFRNLVLALTLAALVMVNVSVFVLLRTAKVVLDPVGRLVEGSRELAAEHFDHRVRVAQQDEFGELARAYNRLAEQLQANEERKAETLRQLAVTLNHDLNNAMATIEMQLSLLGRQAGENAGLARYLRDIQTTLARMHNRVASLKNIRRVVLTDYLDGQKMVDLEQSVMPPPPHATSEAA